MIVAQLLTTARAVSMESLEKRDQSGIAVEATWQNIDGEGVADRVDLHTGGMTALPFQGENLIGSAFLLGSEIKVLAPSLDFSILHFENAGDRQRSRFVRS